jgi:hypothetical protein
VSTLSAKYAVIYPIPRLVTTYNASVVPLPAALRKAHIFTCIAAVTFS